MADFFRKIFGGPRRLETDMGDTSHADRVIAHPPFDLLTDGGDGPSRRFRVDPGSTGFFAGREFRAYYEFSTNSEAGDTSIGAGTTRLMRINVPLNVILQSQLLDVDSGAIRVSNWFGGTVTDGAWNTTIMPVIGKNNMSDRPAPFYASPMKFDVATAGAYNKDGFRFAVGRKRVASASGQASSTTATANLPRGVGSGTYYILLENIGTGSVQGTLEFEWEERP